MAAATPLSRESSPAPPSAILSCAYAVGLIDSDREWIVRHGRRRVRMQDPVSGLTTPPCRGMGARVRERPDGPLAFGFAVEAWRGNRLFADLFS